MDEEIFSALERAEHIYRNASDNDYKVQSIIHYNLRAISIIEMEKLREIRKQGVTLMGILKVLSVK